MPYKPGGGSHLQHYDESNGQYDEETKASLNSRDKRELALFYYFDIETEQSKKGFYYPSPLVHDREYCFLFIQYIGRLLTSSDIDITASKAEYLLTFNPVSDKSAFLESIGYSLKDWIWLISDICHKTDFTSLQFSRFTKIGTLSCKAKTNLKGKIVTTIWELTRELQLHFITLIPGGDKKWN